MTGRHARLALLSCAALQAAALRSLQEPHDLDLVANSRHGACVPPGAYRQELVNSEDMQYHARLEVGGQTLEGIIDTGSFELVVFSKGCSTCGIAGLYDQNRSSTFAAGHRVEVQAYGSGSCTTRDARDRLDLGCYTAPAQSMWLATDCQMPVLTAASFQAIVGVGPPGQPELTARKVLESISEAEAKFKAKGMTPPQKLEESRQQFELKLQDARDRPSLLENLGFQAFSHCIGRKPGSPAFMIWNDVNRRGLDGVMTFGMAGEVTWSVKVDSVTLKLQGADHAVVGCEQGCGAIFDTGTSLFAVPTAMYRQILNTLVSAHLTDCNQLASFPSLVINIEGKELHFPPSSYVGLVQGEVNPKMARYFSAGALGESAAAPQAEGATVPLCSLLLMNMGEEQTEFGPLFIMGMPLFRQYYTTFHISPNKKGRAISVMPADDDCQPDLRPLVHNVRGRNQMDITPRVIDASKLRLPRWLEERDGSIPL